MSRSDYDKAFGGIKKIMPISKERGEPENGVDGGDLKPTQAPDLADGWEADETVGAESAPEDGLPAEEPMETPPVDWEAEAKRFEDLYLRALAEQENARRRFQKEKEETDRYASESVIRDIIPLLDNLNLALSYAQLDDPAVKNLAEGVNMTIKGCLDRLGERGLKEVAVARGDPFDPNVHEAIGQEPDPELPDKSVCRLIGKGYFLRQRLLRPAKVVVVKNEPPLQ
ncbi:MAG: nucleotide exchange factor GrpE [Deltaproteobacteria bacterium]|jgi:molecular chaperone GrpE|nr:nucleotide exchange factor GrpE [Deltaproteobacteria bacterium]